MSPEKIILPIHLCREQHDVLAHSAIRALVRKGVISREDITVEMAQQGVPGEWAALLFQYIQQMPIDDDAPIPPARI